MSEQFVDHYLAYLLARASHLVSREFHAVVKTDGLTVAEWRVLATLADRPPVGVGTLADMVLMQQPTLTKLLDRMGDQGWVERIDDTGDRRRVMATLTEAGRQRVQTLIGKAAGHEAEVIAKLPGADVTALKQTLENLIELLSKQA